MSIFPVPPELKLTACLLLLLACSLPVLAAPAIYDVEVIIFTNNTSGDNGERSSKPAGVSGNTGAFRDGEFTELARGLYRLDNISNALQQSRGYSVLFHRAWRQLATGRETAAAYPVHSLVSGNSGIEGNVRLVLERYLHLDVNLLLMSARGTTGGAVYSDGPGSVPVYELREQRRIRSGELHYFDHPRFGMIARVTPYAIPEAAAVAEPAAAPEPEDPVPAPVDDQLTR